VSGNPVPGSGFAVLFASSNCTKPATCFVVPEILAIDRTELPFESVDSMSRPIVSCPSTTTSPPPTFQS
jgi:hypothetical protein